MNVSLIGFATHACGAYKHTHTHSQHVLWTPANNRIVSAWRKKWMILSIVLLHSLPCSGCCCAAQQLASGVCLCVLESGCVVDVSTNVWCAIPCGNVQIGDVVLSASLNLLHAYDRVSFSVSINFIKHSHIASCCSFFVCLFFSFLSKPFRLSFVSFL